jgi:hypothetical protein
VRQRTGWGPRLIASELGMAALPPLRRQSDSTTHLAHPLQHHTQPQLPLKPATHQPRSEATEAQHLDAAGLIERRGGKAIASEVATYFDHIMTL